MDYSAFSRDELIERVQEQERLNHELLMEKQRETALDYAWTGNLGHWYWDIRANRVTFNPLKVTTLGYSMCDLPDKVTYSFFTDKLHPEDYTRVMHSMMDHLSGKSPVYETEYRIQSRNGEYKWYYDRGKITRYDDNEKPLFLAGIVFDITDKKEQELDLKRKNRILSEQSYVDDLTQINNYRSLIEHLNTSIANLRKTGTPLSIAMLDIDDFKKVNDTMGHVAGDKVLAGIAGILSDNIRETDFAGRYGGEEFMLILPHTGAAEAKYVTERIRSAVELQQFPEGIHVTISGGIREYRGESITDFIHAADLNLYEAKRNGKNQIV